MSVLSVFCLVFFLFFKQKTAYEMRISDWSSDVCSSDLPAFAGLRDDLLAILDSDARIAYVDKIGPYYYNFWRDKTAVRGIWRRTTPESYRSAQPEWETVVDLDALAESENENWVWHGAQCLRPDYTRCLVSLSRGGADTDVSREFATETPNFHRVGFRSDDQTSE